MFKEDENTACFTCSHVLNKNQPILFVSHDKEGDWQFLCGAESHDSNDAKVISLKETTELDPSVNDLYEMPLSIGAERNAENESWKPFKLNY